MTNAFHDLFAQLVALINQDSGIFITLGTNLFSALAVIILVWFGIQWAFAGGMQMDRFINMMLSLSFCFAMVHFYAAPIPGFGVSFYHLILDEGTTLATKINNGSVTRIYNGLDTLYLNLETPGVSAVILNALDVIRWAVVISAITAAECAIFFVIAFGYVASTICVLLGPIFIPFFIVPKLEWIFWGWLRAFLQYAFYPVVANAYLFVFGALLVNITQQPLKTSGDLAAQFVPLLFLLCAFTWGIIKIPSLVNSLFTGRSGEAAFPNIKLP